MKPFFRAFLWGGKQERAPQLRAAVTRNSLRLQDALAVDQAVEAISDQLRRRGIPNAGVAS